MNPFQALIDHKPKRRASVAQERRTKLDELMDQLAASGERGLSLLDIVHVAPGQKVNDNPAYRNLQARISKLVTDGKVERMARGRFRLPR